MRAGIYRLTLGAFLACTATMQPGQALADGFDQYPKTGAEAMAYYEGDVDAWLEGPVRYLILDGEREVFASLENSEQRAAFIDWFWSRRDDDLKVPGNAAQDAFYERVATANARYHDFPRGWKSDRGQVHVTLGAPHAVRPIFGLSREALVWAYYTVGPRSRDLGFSALGNELTIAFTRSLGRYDYEIYGDFAGRGYLPLYVREAFEYARRAAITEPDLELHVN